MATNAMCQITDNFDEYARLTSLLKGELDWQASMEDAKDEGRAEAHEEDRQYFLGMLDQGLSVEEIKQRLNSDNK